jgi:hypothetical protein
MCPATRVITAVSATTSPECLNLKLVSGGYSFRRRLETLVPASHREVILVSMLMATPFLRIFRLRVFFPIYYTRGKETKIPGLRN